LPLAVITAALMGVMSLLMGLLAETLSRTYYESQGKTPYIIRELINFDGANPPQARSNEIACAESPASSE